AVLVSQPATARQLLAEVTTSSHASFFDLVGDLSERQPVDQRWQRLTDALDRVRKQADQDKVVADLNVYRQWAFTVARFSFHTQDLLHDLDPHGLD
ncbi:MAG: hypothetical protein KY395_06045, partial [Actinobacteria bacterium]|nr:hypothetical protein [Actinomycetota bacterium]